jgi:coupling of ubiquitin conjugation to ER degradation protein 1
MMEQTKKKEEQSNSTEKSEIAEQSTSTKSFDDMSVDELNSLTTEQRREQMLKALDQRNN